MKVADIMQRQVDFVSPEATVRDVSRIIFGRNINGVPVCTERKVVGFVTERDILAQFYPTIEEYVEDPVHASDFEEMEKELDSILSLPVKKIMSKHPATINEDTPILRAQSLMFSRKVGRLPVVDSDNNLVGIVAKGDIFRAVVEEKLSLGAEEEFYDWLAANYDTLIDWKKRLRGEAPGLARLLRKEGAISVVDIASSTGEHAIALAKRGFTSYGVEASSLMNSIAEGKKKHLEKDVQKKLMFLRGNYRESVKKLPETVDAAIFMGDALAHVLLTDKNILSRIRKILNPKQGVLFFQILNYEKLFETSSGLRHFITREGEQNGRKKQIFLDFYTRGGGKKIAYNMAIFDFVGDKWMCRGVNSTSLIPLNQREITGILRGLGFSTIEIYGGFFNGMLFDNPFSTRESDWLNIVAKR